MTLTHKEMKEYFGDKVGASLYKMCLQNFNTVKMKRVTGSFVLMKSFEAKHILAYMDKIRPHSAKCALWQQNKEIIKIKIKELL